MKRDIYQEVTNTMIAQLEAGPAAWRKSWTSQVSDGMPIRSCGTPYQGVNVLILWIAQAVAGHTSNQWMTYKQAVAKKAQVRKGQKGTHIVFTSTFTRENKQTGLDETVPFLKSYTVFNTDQIDGLPVIEKVERDPIAAVAHADEYFAATGADIRHGGSRAFYVPSADHIQMPNRDDFKCSVSYYGTLAHETIHWTGHADRLARELNTCRFGNEAYAFEELVAELGAAFVTAKLALEMTPREDHASYVASWLKVLKGDKKAIFKAATLAQKASVYLDGE